MDFFSEALAVMDSQMGYDVCISLATLSDSGPSVRVVDGYYHGGSLYVVSHTASHIESLMNEFGIIPDSVFLVLRKFIIHSQLLIVDRYIFFSNIAKRSYKKTIFKCRIII